MIIAILKTSCLIIIVLHKRFRPYLSLGRPVTRKRMGMMFEAGV